MSFRFGWVLAFLVIQVILWLIWQLKDGKRYSIYPGASEKVKTVSRINLDNKRVHWRNRMILIGLALLALAASGPQIGTRVRPIERKGVDLVIALDTSTSMDAEDVTPSRLAKAKFELGRLIRKLKGDRVAIIVFAGSSHLYLPLTTDYEAALLFLNEIDTDMIPTQGTALSSAMNTAMTAFTEETDKYKVMLMVTDGEDHEGQAVELAAQAAQAGLMINTVGVGSKLGSLIPVKGKNDTRSQYKRDREGKLITSTLNERILKDIAAAGNGSFFWFDNNRDTHEDIALAIENMEKKTISTHEFSEYEDRYQAFALLAFGFLIWGFVMPTRPREKS
jgi:Ca-activated chloride channel family protein